MVKGALIEFKSCNKWEEHPFMLRQNKRQLHGDTGTARKYQFHSKAEKTRVVGFTDEFQQRVGSDILEEETFPNT